MNNIFIRSGYSFFESMLSIEKIINFAKINNWKKVALIDKNIMFGAFEFIELAKKNQIIPIIGLEISLISKIFIAKNFQGYNELIKISSLINSLNFDKNDIYELILISKNLFEVSNSNTLNFSSYETINDLETFKIFLKIENSTLKSIENKIPLENSEKFLNKEQIELLKEINEIEFSFEQIITNYKQTLNFSSENDLLKFKEDLNLKLNDYLKLKNIQKFEIYEKRLHYEFETIKQMNFENYFFIVEDYVKWARKQDIYVGPGRGSAPGSLISFLLEITQIDPIENNLIFERFLNPERINIPDIDIDFQDDRREEVINYIYQKYSSKNVAQIITFQTFQSKNTIKDIAKIFEISFKEVNDFTKLFIDRLSFEQNLTKKDIKIFITKNPHFLEIINHAKKIINLPRQTSTHASGLIISSINIDEIIPTISSSEGFLKTQYSMNFLEIQGLIKFDILGLKHLGTLKQIYKLIKMTKNKDLSLQIDNFNDQEVFKILTKGQTLGIFQLESPGMRDVLKKVKITSFEDIVSVISLFRPGPKKHIDSFANRKNNIEKFSYDDDILLNILSKTYGIIVYQEQILEIAKQFSGFSYSQADNLRRAISKKDVQKMELLREQFIAFALKNGKTEILAKKIYDLIFEFANYGFNRSHAYSYAIISYNFAYLKANYPIEFSASYLSSIEKEAKKIKEYIDSEDNIVLLLPSINNSFAKFSLEKQGIRFGFSSINGLGLESVNKILNARNNFGNKFNNLYEAIIYLNHSGITNTVFKILIKSGVFDEFGHSREAILEVLEKLLKFSALFVNKENQVSLSIVDKDDYPEISFKMDNNNLEYEEELLGLKISNRKKD